MSTTAVTKTVATLNLAGAEGLCDAALAEAQRLKIKPVSVAIVNGAGQILLHKVQDGAPSLTPNMALAKARTCLTLNTSTRTLRDKYAAAKPTQLAAMGAIAGGHFAPFPGGVLCKLDGQVVGAIGVSGASSEEDEHCGVAAARAVGLASDPAESALS
mmetsp:Transcript_643/g.1749  ORF Transcript_643/g.1749 Transcript_643/m.1749 type:complete len:158 (-) Transcript_643:45-518(-)|eukprot:CAMPEP_0197413598 /NCGR_PEP_ID=MMETSP1170-20131217/455_1 /TAXON_ID=54406 /ORGANISM="Sarcinochrysis sp, Strain CCMP770" /LENGTH=157 /DNA_ID=CAMNT_0042940203 /DNA_START=45 /DNA_END=518 /DNA_ORIENTATION=-